MTDTARAFPSEAERVEPDKPLPRPARVRWQPLRSGLVNLFRFDRVEFPFSDGRLLLRGNNGSGKSRVLALQLPFLIDGETGSHRVEPDGDPAKRMEWNLLMNEHEDRLGYTWIEFGRRDDEGNEHFLTLGCGLRATKGRGVHAKWFFITPLRYGRDFELHNTHNQPLTQDKLAETLGDRGTIYRQTREYRRAVNESLFKLGARYEPLLELLLRLRQPKLSEKLDETVLSNALSEALTPLPASLVTEVAESFRGLEADRDELTGFERARDAVTEFLEDYRTYVRVAARRRAESVRLTHSAYETNQRKQREAEETRSRAESERIRLQRQHDELEDRLSGTRQTIRTLRESPEMRRADDLEHARKEAERAERRSREHAADAEKAKEAYQRAEADHRRSETESAETARRAAEAAAEARTRAVEAGLAAEHGELFPRAPDDEPAVPDDLERARRTLETTLTSRREAIGIVETKNRILSEAADLRTKKENARREATDALSESRSALRAAEKAFEEAADEQLAAYRRWTRSVSELEPADADTLFREWETWLESTEGESPLIRARDAARDVHIRAAETERSGLRREQESLRNEIADARGEIERLEAGAQAPPETPATRPADRSARPGAPFWKLLDFHDSVAPRERAGLEAALQASGLLDAWVLPDGTVVDPETEDAFLLSDTNSVRADRTGPGLDRFLKPCSEALNEEGAALPGTAAVDTLLTRIGTDPSSGPYWISPDGSYRLGPLQGRWSKAEPEHIGESSRAAARKRRIAELTEEIAGKNTRLDELEQSLNRLAEREEAARREAEAAPADTAVREQAFRSAAARRNVINAVTAEEKAREQAEEAAEAFQKAKEERDREAADLRLSEWVDRLGELRDSINHYDKALAALWPTLDHWHRARAHAENARQRFEQTRRDLEEQSERLRRAERDAANARQHYETLEQTSGKEAREILAKLQEAESAESTLGTSLKENEKKRFDVGAALAQAEERLRHLEEERIQATAERDKAVEAFRRFAAERLLADAHENLSDAETDFGSVSRAVELARRTEQVLSAIEAGDDAWSKHQQTIHRRIELLRDSLVPQGHSPDTRQMDDLLIIRVPFRGRDCSATELHAAFTGEIEERRRLLDERERAVIENHLLSETATEIQRLLREAEEWVGETNRELESRPTSTGMRLRFAWEADPEGPSGLEAARRQLRQRAELWSEEQRTGLARFFQERIEAERVENPSASWPDRLFRALDYRRWHRFSIERQQDGQWKRLTRRTHGTGSGGEKAIALTIPQFAAAAAHYRSAAPEAPRLILLDEVFVGIDSEMRANCMALLSQFDLDFLMTSEREWGCYPSIPALSICHLSTRPGFNAIAVTRWTWNGRERRRV